ncbi:hypothetical protein R1flu_007818 [Riccia fluitans]|uniref:SOUL heme-binding protein n=1 Tax=Riccia fluitans TaxID=41844 RepID=A0ABD1Z2K6_9MARC
MGMFLGKIMVETPKYTVVEKGTDYEVREYSSWVVAETAYDPSKVKGGRDGGFMFLASFIGAFGKAENSKPGEEGNGGSEKIAMTAPVITSESSGEKIAMTAPVITKENESVGKLTTMQFVLPSSYTIENVPKPTDSRVIVKEMPGRMLGVITFSGSATDSLTKQKLGILESALKGAGYKITGDHMLARYNDPFTPWFLRTNEVMVPVEKEDS